MDNLEVTAAAIAAKFHAMEDEGEEFAAVCEATRDAIAQAADHYGVNYDDVDGIVAAYL